MAVAVLPSKHSFDMASQTTASQQASPSASKSLKKFRDSLRTATTKKPKETNGVDESTVRKDKGKEKERDLTRRSSKGGAAPGEEGGGGTRAGAMLRKAESKLAFFRRGNAEPAESSRRPSGESSRKPARLGFAFQPPTLSKGSMSSPTLPLFSDSTFGPDNASAEGSASKSTNPVPGPSRPKRPPALGPILTGPPATPPKNRSNSSSSREPTSPRSPTTGTSRTRASLTSPSTPSLPSYPETPASTRRTNTRTASPPPSPSPPSRNARVGSPTSPSLSRITRLPAGSASTSHLPPSTPPLVTSSSRRKSNASPTPSRSMSPTYHRHNSSSNSLAVSSPYRDTIRSASSLLVKEMARPPRDVKRDAWEDVEIRLRALTRLERIWSPSGASSSTATVGTAVPVSAGNEDRERRAFVEGLRDGYVLCMFMNKLRPGTISRISKNEDGFTKTTNVTKFLEAAKNYGVPEEELFLKDDLIEASPEGLARVAQTLISVAKIAESPTRHFSSSRNPYGTSNRSAIMSTPNLTLGRSTSPTATKTKRWSPPTPGLETVPDTGSQLPSAANSRFAPVEAEVPSPPPRNPARLSTTSRTSIASTSQLTESTNNFSSLLDHRSSTRFGTIRTVNTEATSFIPSEHPSMTPSEARQATRMLQQPPETPERRDRRPSIGKLSSSPPNEDLTPRRKDRRTSEPAPVIIDLTKVPEEGSDDSPPSKPRPAEKIRLGLGKGVWPDDFMNISVTRSRSPPTPTPISVPSTRAHNGEVDLSTVRGSSPSISPPRPQGLVNSNEFDDMAVAPPVPPKPLAPRRPGHGHRRSADALLPKEVSHAREPSPSSSRDSSTPSPGAGLPLRRNSSRNSPRASYVPKEDRERGPYRNINLPSHRSAAASSPAISSPHVPFPRSVSGENPPSRLATLPSSSETLILPAEDRNNAPKPPRQQRGRYQSDINGSIRPRKLRPTSLDDGGTRPNRSRYESMVNLGASSSSASDLRSRDGSMASGWDGSAVREMLVVREEGKLPVTYKIGKCIGRGQFGSVYQALNDTTGQVVAVKRIRLEGLGDGEVKQLMKEVDLLKGLAHPSIVRYEGMVKDSDSLCIILEYAENGSLSQMVKSFGKMKEDLVAGYVIKILEGLHYLHGQHVVHCDLKAANILNTKTGNIKLSDFGVSLNMHAVEQIKGETYNKEVAGTPNWMAPEVIELKGASPASDIWSLACTVVELLTGRPPYAEIGNPLAVMYHIVEEGAPPLPEEWSEDLRDFLNACFQRDPAKRPTAEMLGDHPWVKKRWAKIPELRPKDSIPFLRRVSADLHKSDLAKQLSMDFRDTPTPDSPGSPPRHYQIPSSPIPPEPEPPREHAFVRSTFHKAVMCRVCQEIVNAKKHAVICETCGLIAHSRCALDAPAMCTTQHLVRRPQRAQSPGQEVTVPNSPNSPLQTPTQAIPIPPRSTSRPRDSVSSSPSHGFSRSPFSWKKSKVPGSSSVDLRSTPDQLPVPPKKTMPGALMKSNGDARSHRSHASYSSSQNSTSVRSAVTANESLPGFVIEDRGPRAANSPSEIGHIITAPVPDANARPRPPLSHESHDHATQRRPGNERRQSDNNSRCIVQ